VFPLLKNGSDTPPLAASHWRGLRGRLVATYLLLIIVSMGLLVGRAGLLLQHSREEEARKELQAETALVAGGLEEHMEKYVEGKESIGQLQGLAKSFRLNEGIRVVVFDGDGRRVADTADVAPEKAGLKNWPEIQRGLRGDFAESLREEPGFEGPRLIAVAPIRHDMETIGAVQVSVPWSEVTEQVRQDWLSLASATLFTAILTVIVSLWLARGIIRPLQEMTAAAIQIAEGDLHRRIAVQTDDELGQLGRSFNHMAARIAKMVGQQKEFVANASHELRTPLTSIRLRVEALLNGAKDDEEVAIPFLQEIEAETDRLSRMVDELLDLSRYDAGLVSLHRVPVALDELVDDVIVSLDPQARHKQVHVATDMPDELNPVVVDRDRIRSVLVNLLGNALKFASPHGSVLVRIRQGEQARQVLEEARDDVAGAPISAQLLQGSWTVLSVTDNGPGIAPGDLPHIFDRFYRTDKARPRQVGGTGLGLAIARSIVEAHGGYVWADSDVGKGATFFFAVPSEAAAA
jgi:signal transduction histidine kinase